MPSVRPTDGAGRIDDGVVVLEELVVRDVAADLDVEADGRALVAGDRVEHRRRVLGAEVVRRDTVAYETVRRREAIDDRDLDVSATRGGQLLGDEPASRT